VPRQNRNWGHNGGDLAQDLPAKRLALGRQSTTLFVGETQASPARFQLLLQNAILFNQVRNQVRLLTPDPSSERGQEKLKLDGLDHAASISEVRASGGVSARSSFRILRGMMRPVQ
jgi:hypothetical protein